MQESLTGIQTASDSGASARSPLDPRLPEAADRPLSWARLRGDAFGLAIAAAAQRHSGLVVVATPDSQQAAQVERELGFFAPEMDLLAFPDWETLPYDLFSPHEEIVSRRLETLHRLPQGLRGVLVVPAPTLLQRLPPRAYLAANTLLLDVGDRLDLDTMRRRLEQSGYRCVSQVMEHGEFAVRGSLLDLFPAGSAQPYRIDLLDEEVESIRTFDPESQRTTGQTRSIRLLPAREFPLTEDAVARFRQAWRARFEGDPQRCPVYREVSQSRAPGGVEYYLPLFHPSTETLFDYLPSGALLIALEGLEEAADRFHEQVQERHEQRRHDLERPVLPPGELYLQPDELRRGLTALPRVRLQRFEDPQAGPGDAGVINYATASAPAVPLQPRAADPAAALRGFLDRFPGRVLLVAGSTGRREAVLETLRGFDLRPQTVADWPTFVASDLALAIAVGELEQGLILEDPPIAVLTEAQLFGERALQRRRRRTGRERDAEAIVRELTDLDVGAPVVHEEHGVGRYQGLQRLEVGGTETEFLALDYAGGDRLYVPVASLHLVARYTGAAPEAAPLHKLGGDQWQRVKRQAAERARDVAAELLDIYARRAAQTGHVYHYHTDEYHAFAAAFPFEETDDQEAAIEAVLTDMGREQPMDRVICGDVGFGKTEVAMRAAFVAVQDARQVAVLVPTTLLAQQHYQNFQDRFADWPVRVDVVSRFRTRKELDRLLADLRQGKIDILIGTHRLLQSDVKFANLGLVILDEEHRFGVRQKERLKALRAQVDVLTMTATPIPRTLNMALSRLRDLSVIATPPAERMAIKTFVSEWDKTLLQEALLRELKRGGQVFFLHNDVANIGRMADQVRELVPDTEVRIAHGQMPERELEHVMLDFYHQRFNILVCTTIIESGIDVPTANTIIINRADKFGLAQLHQLRGRVGRSHHRAYAYLLVPSRRQLTADALKRLEAIESLEELGSGFMLATHDLEIRGAGELLGEEQSGQIAQVGYTLYTELLERAVKALKSGRQPELERPLDHGPEVEMGVPALLPEDYLPDVHTRLVMYKRIASAPDKAALRDLQVEMIDRFGLLPQQVKNLFRVTELKLKATGLGIARIEAGPQGGRLLFGRAPAVDPAKLVELIQRQPDRYRLDGQEKLRFSMALDDPEMRVKTVEWLLDSLAPQPSVH